ncbi:DUF2726 domain-containing protein [Pandoraea sputorum]|uniref:DUF2726 domain-containing protein n=1 Tax=Pandoraea sputorum TaxID=93222 RepID=UPI002B28F35E|nr:hypothetical protein THI4931_47070 [Pandoraea sputorum]
MFRMDFSVVTVVELDDPWHDRQRQSEYDAKKDEAMRAVKVHLIRFDVRNYPTEHDVRKTTLETEMQRKCMVAAA